MNSGFIEKIEKFYEDWKYLRNYEDRTRFYDDLVVVTEEEISDYLLSVEKKVNEILKSNNLTKSSE